ncbi:hypothetical protein Tco_0804348 [Tanacetum coccineum]|uniref:Uncharacterized protein n=1 Tax=Tanacetum coccineum TaxID=301880 RepID=A0ABQ5A428_9ASTR
MESVKKSIGERAQHKMQYERRVNERQIQTTEEKTDTSNALDALDARQQNTEQPEFNNEGKVDQNAEQCHDICPLPAKLTDDKTTELSNQSLESENVCLKKTVAQCQKDFAKLEAHCINLELQMQNNVLKSGQQSQFLKEKSNEAKVKNDIDVATTGRILETVCLSWVPKRKDILSSTARLKVNPQMVQMQISLTNVKANKLLMSVQAPFLNDKMMSVHISSGLVLHQMTSDHNRSELGIQDHSNEPSSSKLVLKVVPLAVKTATSRQELELLFHHHIAMPRTTVEVLNGFLHIMIEPEVPLMRKDQIALDEQIAKDIPAKLDAELLEEQKLARKQEEEANIA